MSFFDSMEKKKQREAERKAMRLEYLAGFDLSIYSADQVALIEKGDIEVCPCCSQASGYCWDDCNIEPNQKPGIGGIAHIPTASGFDWQCGHCGATLAPSDSPILADCYTHNDSDSDE
jgi:hypothetical protein